MSTTPTPPRPPTSSTLSLATTAEILKEVQAPSPGEVIDNLEILNLIASGGMADVYRVRHTVLEVERALKVLKANTIEQSSKRLRTEAKISAHLTHPNIVQIFNSGLWKQVIPYIEMEYIDGHSLQQICERDGRLPATVACALGIIVCRALVHAANQTYRIYGKEYQGIVHRDIKPANILISRGGQVKLADFGIALPGSISIHTMGEGIMGTYPYLSPEQVENRPLDVRSDLYSTGTVLYEIIGGRKAYPQKSAPEVISAITAGKYTPLRSLVPDLSPALIKCIRKCMQPAARRRFQNAHELEMALQRVLTSLTSWEAEKVVREYVTAKRVAPLLYHETAPRRKALTFLLIGGGLVACMLAVFLRVWQYPLHSVAPAPVASSSDIQKETPSPVRPPQPVTPPQEITRTHTKQTAPTPSRESVTPEPSTPPSQKEQVRAWSTALTAFGNGEFARAVSLFSKVCSQSGTVHHDECGLYLAEAYLRLEKFDAARRFLDQTSLRDARYFLVKGALLAADGNYEDALATLEEAQTRPSGNPSRDVRPEAAYVRARVLGTQYARKPNVHNKQRLVRALERYQTAFCTTAFLDRCADIQRRLQELQQ